MIQPGGSPHIPPRPTRAAPAARVPAADDRVVRVAEVPSPRASGRSRRRSETTDMSACTRGTDPFQSVFFHAVCALRTQMRVRERIDRRSAEHRGGLHSAERGRGARQACSGPERRERPRLTLELWASGPSWGHMMRRRIPNTEKR